MVGPVTIDASVLVRATNLSEPGQRECEEVIAAVGSKHLMVVQPTLVIAEAAGAMGRRRLPAAGIAEVLSRVVRSSAVTLIPLDESLSNEAAELAIATRLRGADAVYVATARRYGTTLVTADEEQLLRARSVVPAMLPAEFLATAGTN